MPTAKELEQLKDQFNSDNRTDELRVRLYNADEGLKYTLSRTIYDKYFKAAANDLANKSANNITGSADEYDVLTEEPKDAIVIDLTRESRKEVDEIITRALGQN